MAKIVEAKLSDIEPDANNANLHTERGVYMVNKSLEKLGAGRSILLDKNNKIIAGNLTTEQAADVGLEKVIIVDTDGRELVAVRRTDLDLDDPHGQARQMAYADNRAATVSIDIDPERVALDFDAGVELGDWFQDFELAEFGIGDDPPEDVAPQIDRADELRQKWGVELGQVWELGRHKLWCADSFELNSQILKGDLLLSDPPFDFDEKKQASMLNKSKSSSIAWLGASPHIYEVYKHCQRKDYRWSLFWDGGREMTVKNDKRPIISADIFLVFGKIVFNNLEALSYFAVDYKQVPHVLKIGRPFIAEHHKNEKPLRLWNGIISLLSNKSDVIIDPFVGSGISFVSCELTGRDCRGVDIDPGCVAVTLQRYYDHTGVEPCLLIQDE